MKKAIWLSFLFSLSGITCLRAQTTSFSFSAAAHATSGWINVSGDPAMGVRTGSDPSTGITISSVATTNWYPYSSTNAAYDGGGVNTNGFFPGSVFINQWFQYNPATTTFAVYNAAVPQLIIGGLKPDSTYTLKMSGSNSLGFDSNPARYTVSGAVNYGFMDLNTTNNTANGVVFHNISPDASGNIKVYINTILADNTEVANISGIQIICEHTAGGPTPAVQITSPSNNDILAEETNIIINATATETGGTITKVEFYADTTKLGESLSAPYSFTWINPAEGHYTLKAKAIDANGASNIASIMISVESQSSFWSMTGNIGMNPDSNFVGNVDSVRLAFRTKNIERMSISPTGNVGIGAIHPSAQLHTTGTVRLAGLTGDSTKNRVLVSDTSGNLFYRNISSLSNRWQSVGATVFDSADNVAIGTTTVPTGYKLAVNGTAIFTKVRVKTAGSWPDYVFKKGYVLPDLNELEQYIAVHKHLPGIVSESEANQNGVDVGDHQEAMLKKVEELTLYLIEENKRLKEQRKQADRQNTQIEQQNKQIGEQNARLEKQQQEIDELKELIRNRK